MKAIVLAVGFSFCTPQLYCQNGQTGSGPTFDVASVKRCKDGDNFGGIKTSPGGVIVTCAPLESLIHTAYITYADGHWDPFSTARLEGGPSWIGLSQPVSNWYTINAKAEGSASKESILGPMMQTLLEDRFKLKIHREARNVRAYVLTSAKGENKLKSFDGSCVPRGQTQNEPPAGDAPQKPICNGGGLRTGGGRTTVDLRGASLAEFADTLGTVLERRGVLDGPVIDKTGISGLYDIHFEFSSGSATGLDTPVSTDPAGGATPIAPLFDALPETLGLRLNRSTAPQEVIVIDHIERATEN